VDSAKLILELTCRRNIRFELPTIELLEGLHGITQTLGTNAHGMQLQHILRIRNIRNVGEQLFNAHLDALER